MDDDLFELEYADELDAIEDIEPDNGSAPKSRRSLQFATPSSKTERNRDCTAREDPNSSFLLQQGQSPKNSLNDTIYSENDDLGADCQPEEKDDDSRSVGQQKKKRSVWETDLLDSAADDFFDSLPDLEPQNKRARASQHDNGKNEENIKNVRFSREGNHVRRRNNEPESFDEYQLRLIEGYDLERRRVLRSIPQGDYISATSYEGRRVYMKVVDKQEFEQEIDSMGYLVRQTALLTVPISVMREQLEDERRRQVLHEAEELSARVRRELDDTGDAEMDVEETRTNHRPGALWVEKYAPRSYTDLLSEEAINRTLLHWLKQWDYVVFDKDLPMVKNKKKGKDAPNNKWKKFQPEVSTELDAYSRPVQKVVLLCGPPGLGKTTLAHVVAAHAGYNVVEMNASDDRSVDVFRNKIEAATQMKAVMGVDPRPNCLVIDEIDGAPQPAVNVLLNILKRPEGSGNKKKKEGDMLLRPVICICNDQYAPSLRQLRQQALVMNFPPTEPSRLASRLSEVVRREHLKADLNTLMALCERTDNDIRSCLNTLQFIRQKQAELTLRSVQTMSVGQKDAHKSLFSVWKDIFTMPRPKRNRFVSIYDMMEGKADSLQLNTASPTARFQHVLGLAQATGEYERIIQGLFENYLQAKSKDPHLVGLNLATEWLCFVDGLSQYTAHTQDYSVMKYVPFLHVTFHLLYAAYVPPRITFPHVQFEVHQAHTKITNLLVALLADMTPAVRKFLDIRNLTLDLLPPLLDILQPTLRPVNTQLYSSREKDDLAHLVHIMINYNMTYRQERSPEGQYTYVLDPNVEEVVRFSGTKQRKQLTYGAKQLIAREIDLEKLRRNEAASISSSQKSRVVVPNHKQTLEAKAVVEEKLRVNYFAGFTRTKRETQNMQKDDTKEKEKEERNVLDTDIWFHFKEGYSNAVRRNVKIQDLL